MQAQAKSAQNMQSKLFNTRNPADQIFFNISN